MRASRLSFDAAPTLNRQRQNSEYGSGWGVAGDEGVGRRGVHTTTSCAEIIIIFEKQVFRLFSTVYATCDHNINFLKAIVQRFLINNYLEFKQRFKQ